MRRGEKTIRNVGRAALLAAALTAGLAGRASAACDVRDSIYHTTFSEVEDGWDISPHLKIAHGKMVLSPTPQIALSPLYEATPFSDGTVCADFAVSKSKGADPEAGLIFWASDNSRFFQFVISPLRKYASIGEYRDGKFKQIVDWQHFAFIRSGKNDANELAVRLRGYSLSATVNGRPAFAFEAADEPPDEWHAGIDAEASTTAPAVWDVTNFTVSK